MPFTLEDTQLCMPAMLLDSLQHSNSLIHRDDGIFCALQYLHQSRLQSGFWQRVGGMAVIQTGAALDATAAKALNWGPI